MENNQSPPAPDEQKPPESFLHTVINQKLAEASDFGALHPELTEKAGYEIRELIDYLDMGRITKDQFIRLMAHNQAQIESNKMQEALGRLEAEGQSNIDQLTGLHKKNSFDKYLDDRITAIHKGESQGRLAVTFVDIDNFGNYNSEFTQAAGDKVLKEFSKSLIGSTRASSDMVARYGGEEFTIAQTIKPENLDATADLTNPAERIRSRIDITENERKITASLGTTSYYPGDTKESLVFRANVAMNIAKLLGKNRTVSADVGPNAQLIFSDLSENAQGQRIGHEYSAVIQQNPEGNSAKIVSLEDMDTKQRFTVSPGVPGSSHPKPYLTEIQTNG